MEQKILVMLEDVYGYLHYGLLKHLSKLDDYNFFGFISNEKDVSFFNNQKEIKFSELHYYPQYYIDNKCSTPDLDFLKTIEKKYDLNIWQIAYSERTFLQERNFFHKFTSNEILCIIESLSKFYIEFLSRVKPDFIIMQKTGENMANFLLYNIGKSMGIKTIMLVETRLLSSFVFTDDLLISRLKNEFFQIKNNPPNDLIEYDQNYIKHHHTDVVKSFKSVKFGDASVNKKIKRYSNRIFSDPESIYYNQGKTKSKLIRWRLKQFFEQRKRQNFLDSISIRHIPDHKFVYFPLPVQPEAWSYAWAPFHTNLISIIENIARSIPSEYQLFVKEHPSQKGKLGRSQQFYEQILALPNTRLLHPDLNNYELISKCDLVTLINSSSGLEALFYQKPVIVFTDTFYDVVNMVTKINDISDLPSEIKKCLYSFNFEPKELSYLVKAIENLQIIIPYYEILKDAITLSSIRKHEPVENFIPEINAFSKKFEDNFKLFANEYHKIFYQH